ncbi:hypothetical protein B0T16DRAFT_139624 [Cercophora newfieldiana]|uniref:DUF7580 domain-containing protein n=1 Tax=Cercophora newfieldiana TaxID=92897 RepID=A0AA39Y3L3_9PEZI|nr:hypothetical protein B0T16DRAFT_139624 [Cercophora newfieldiana]
MSGFEIAGVVLGSIPLLISGLEHYRDGVETMDNMIQYVAVVDDILVTVSTSLAIYRQSFEALVQRLMLPENVLDEIWHNRDSKVWKDKSLDDKLKEEFKSPAEYETYRAAVRRLEKRIAKLKSKLELNEDFQPPWMVNGNADADLLGKFFNWGQKLRRAMKTGFNSGKYIELANDIEADINRIKTLTEGTRTLEPIRAERRAKEIAKQWLYVRSRAEKLFTALSSRWPQTCQCPGSTTHIVSIPLGRVGFASTDDLEDQKKNFYLLLSFDVTSQPKCALPWDWRVVEADPLMAPAPAGQILHGSTTNTPVPTPTVILIKDISNTRGTTKSEAPMITDLCMTLSQAQHHVEDLGFLHDDVWEHHLRLVKPWQGLNSNTCFVPVEQVLKTRGSLGTKTKFKTAASLALAVLRFHATPWLGDRWGLRDVFFLESDNNEIDTDQPFLSKNFTNHDLSLSSNHRTIPGPLIDNEVIFALGVALLELFYGRPILDFQKAEDLDEKGGVTPLTRYIIAKRLVVKLNDREPERLVDVIDRCIRCRFDTVSRSLNDPAFLALFIQGVVTELWNIYSTMA